MMISPPPTSMMFDGPPDVDIFRSNGEEFLRLYRYICGLKPDETMLDVGSGIGRKTIPLTEYLSSEGRYEGIDPVRAGVEWCQQNITSQFPNFRFQHVDVNTPVYNPFGEIKPADFQFPFADDTFDFVTLCSVFTHMQYEDIIHYLSEVHRVLKPGGKCLITYFLLQSISYEAQFPHPHPFGCMAQRDCPEQAIAYYEPPIRDMYEFVNLDITEVHYGNWAGHLGLSYQDIIIASKKDK